MKNLECDEHCNPLFDRSVLITLIGLLSNMPTPLLGAKHYGYPLPWLFHLVLAPEYFPWHVDVVALVADLVAWILIVGVALFAWTKIKLRL